MSVKVQSNPVKPMVKTTKNWKNKAERGSSITPLNTWYLRNGMYVYMYTCIHIF